MVSNRQKKKRLIVKAFVMTLFMALFTQFAQAQDVYMHTGSRTVTSGEKVKFYDTGGASSGPDYYWERWFQRNEEFTFTFVPAESGKKIKATFNEFTAYLDNGGYNHAIGADWSLRLNTAVLKVYAGNDVNEANLISSYTGNMTGVFSIVTDGPMTFYFHSYSYREEGWFAEVEMVDEYTIEKPTISFEACSDYVVLNANNPGVKIYYTTDGSDPSVPSKDMLSAGILYTEPFAVEVGKTIRAIAYDETLDETSAVASKTFTTATPTPGIPSISREGNTITMKPAAISEEINETYEVWYSTTSNVFSETDFAQYTRPFEWTQPHTTFYLVTRAKSCSDKMSEVISFPFDKVQVPDPTINFEVTNETTGVGTVTIKCAEGYVISYTLDGSEPAEANGSDSPVVLTDIAPGTTVKAIAFKANASNDYQKSNTITNLCLPGGEGSGGVYGDVVLLDDREDRTWSYYSDATQPIHRLKPADIKITYFGYGEKTMTSTNTDQRPANTAFTTNVDATQVAVNVDEGGNEFIYFKTLENDNTEGQDQGNTYSYTMIPNPFQVRPLYMADKGNNGTMEKSPRIGNIDLQSYAPTEALGVNRGTSDVTYEKVTSSQSDWSGTYLLVYDYSTTTGYALSGVNSSYHGTYTSVTKTNSGNTIASPGSAVLLTFAPYSEDNSYYTVQINNGDYLYSAYSGLMTGSTATNGTYTYDGSTVNYYCYYNVSYSNGTLYLNCPRWQSSGNYYYMQFNTSSNYFDEQLSGTSNYSFPSLYKQTTSGGGGEECAEVGTVNTNNYATTYGPVNDYYNYGYYQIIYPKANVPVGNITSIGFNYRYSTAMTAKNNVTI